MRKKYQFKKYHNLSLLVVGGWGKQETLSHNTEHEKGNLKKCLIHDYRCIKLGHLEVGGVGGKMYLCMDLGQCVG